MPDIVSYVSVATQTKVAALEQQITDLQTQVSSLEAAVSQLSAQLGGTSFGWGDAQAYRDAGELPARRLFVVVDTVANLEALTREQGPENATHAYAVFSGQDVTP